MKKRMECPARGLRIAGCLGLFIGLGSASAAVSIIKGPYLQNMTPTSMVVMWETSAPADSRVDYGATSPGEYSATDPGLVTIHEMTLTGLQAQSRYYYAVSSGGTGSATNTFWTAVSSEAQPYRFVAYGDTRTYPDLHAAVVRSIVRSDPDFVLHVGDFVANGMTYSEWGPQFFDPAGVMMKNTPLFPALGNHEYSGTGQMWYFDFFSAPNNEQWYAFTYGCARFICLAACDYGPSFAPGSAQYTWLTNELRSAEYNAARWHFAWFHQPPYTAVERDGPVNADVRAYLVPLFEQYGLDIAFNGDDHHYRHSIRNGIHYIVTGGGGAPLHDLGTQSPDATLVYAEKTLEHCALDITTTNVHFYAVHTNDTVLDEFTLSYAVDYDAYVTQNPTLTYGTLNGNGIAGTTTAGDGLVQKITEVPSGSGYQMLADYTLHTSAASANISSLVLNLSSTWSPKDANDGLLVYIWNGASWQDITTDILADGKFSAGTPQNYVDAGGNLYVRFSDRAVVRREKKQTLTIDLLYADIQATP